MSSLLDTLSASFYGQIVQAAYKMLKNPQSAEPSAAGASGQPSDRRTRGKASNARLRPRHCVPQI